MGKAVKVAVIGVGFVARQGHIPVLRNASSEIKVVVDPSAEALTWAEKEIPDARTFPSLRQASFDGIDCALICSPPTLHYEQTKFFLEKNIPTFCEKPLATKEREARELVSIASQKNLVLQV